MDSPVYLKWNLPNWITVVLMVALGAVLLGGVASAIQTFNGSANN